MPAFHGSDFEIELPIEYRDESTYAFAFPARSGFRPSLVVKTEHLAQPIDLGDYVNEQLAKIRQHFQGVAIVSTGPVEHSEHPTHSAIFEWGDAARRVRQKQRYILLPDPLRVVTLTATSLQETFAAVEALFDEIFASFRPTGGGPAR